MPDLQSHLAEVPVVAIIRGVEPDKAVATAEAIASAGVRVVEVPMNSPEPLRSIAAISKALPDLCTGAGTVTAVDDVARVRDAGGQAVVAPNCNPAVIGKSLELGMTPVPGFQTPTEAFAAIDAGARYLKLFPAGSAGTSFASAISAVLPPTATLIAVGGVDSRNLEPWYRAGVRHFGIGSDIFKPGMTTEQIRQNTTRIIDAWRTLSCA